MGLLFVKDEEETISLYNDSIKDLAILELIDSMTPMEQEKTILKKILMNMPVHEETIKYRQDILRDFLNNEDLCTDIDKVIGKLKILTGISQNNVMKIDAKSSIWELLDCIRELEVYEEALQCLHDGLHNANLRSEGLQKIKANVDILVKEETRSNLRQDLKLLREQLEGVKSVTLDINLTPDLHVEDVIIRSFSPNRATHTLTLMEKIVTVAAKQLYHDETSMIRYLTPSLEHVLSKQMRLMRRNLKQYVGFDVYFLLDMHDELVYYSVVSKYAKRLMQEGHPICIPSVSDKYEGITIKGLYNIRLANSKEQNIVANDFNMNPKEKIFILTGPNRGGKTMLTQGVGIIVYMANMGLFVPAEEYTGYIIRQIFTHFPADENQTINYGRLGEEAVRMREIVSRMDTRCLLLLNETYSTTCTFDGLYLSKDLMHMLKESNVACIYNTHLHELAFEIDKMNASWDGESEIVSLCMEMKDNKNTFRVLKKAPDASSYAKGVAQKYGITYEQMQELKR